MVWDITLPLDSESEKLGDNRIRDTKQDFQTAMQAESVFPGPDTSNPVCIANFPYGNTAARPVATVANAGRWYYNSQTGTIQRNDSSPAWVDITAPVNVFPSGSSTIFYQSTPPTGWVQIVDSTLNDRAIRVTSGNGMGNGGTDSIASPPKHTHGGSLGSGQVSSSTIPHSHVTSVSTVTIALGSTLNVANQNSPGASNTDIANVSHYHTLSDVVSWTPTYIDVSLATKQ